MFEVDAKCSKESQIVETKHPSYEYIKRRGPSENFPISTVLLRYWEHMEIVHGARPEDYGENVLGWHLKKHPDCATLPTYEEAKKV